MGKETYNLQPYQTKALESLKEKVNETYKNVQISMWGIQLSPPGSPEADVVLLKFLGAKKFDVDRALKKLRDCLSWRQRFGVDSILEEDLGFKELEGVVSCINGVDKEGHPIWWENNYEMFENKEIYMNILLAGDKKKLEKLIRWRVQFIEREVRMLDFKPNGINSFTMVYNGVQGPREFNFFSNHIFPLMKNNYPGLFSLVICLNVPWWVRFFKWNKIILFPKRKKGVDTLYKYIRPEYIPIQYNGLCRPNELKDRLVKPATEEFTLNGGKLTNVTIEGIEPSPPPPPHRTDQQMFSQAEVEQMVQERMTSERNQMMTEIMSELQTQMQSQIQTQVQNAFNNRGTFQEEGGSSDNRS